MRIECEDCGCPLARDNPFVLDGSQKCSPCHTAAWEPAPYPKPIYVTSQYHPEVATQQTQERIAHAAYAEPCDCSPPWPQIEDDGERTCAKCGSWMERQAA